MRSGVTFPVLTDLLRGLYVEVALRDFLTGDRARTDSRASLLTGIHRKEVRRLRAQEPHHDDVPPVLTRTSRIIATWLGTPAYLDAEGRPLALPRLAREGPREGPREDLREDRGVSFETLVGSVTTDIRPRAVLDDWLSQNVVTLDADDRVHLNTAGFLPRPGEQEQLFYFARNLRDHLAAAAANISAGPGTSGPAPFLDRSVHYERLSAETARQLEHLARQVAQRALFEVNAAALALLDAEEANNGGNPSPGATHRINLGVYVFREDEPPAPRDLP
jgi:Family of unknown function (DUF6502)